MRWAFALLLAACELVPAPKPAPPAAAPTDAAVTQPEPDAALDAGVLARPAPTADCVATAQRIANIEVESRQDAGARSNYEKARADIIRALAAACTAQGWTADKQRCFQLATLETDIRACEAMYPRPAAGSGSASL